MPSPALEAIAALPRPELKTVFASDPNRLSKFTLTQGPLRFDWSKTHLTSELLEGFLKLAEEKDFAKWRDALFAGEPINNSEGRAAEHPAERGEGNAESVSRAKMLHARMRALIDAIEGEALGPIRHILHIGIGGSALGPDLIVDALGGDGARYDVAIVSNVDGTALERVIARFDPEATLIAVASKTFTTTETMLNAASAINWLVEAGVEDPYGKVIALTASPHKAIEWGVDETRILPFSETVGGRYSLWSSIGFPAALALGWDAFESLLEGAAAMDRHFRLSDPAQNAPLIAAFVDQYYGRIMGCQTRALFAYDERLRLLPSYLQQLEMESNGKSVTRDGKPVDGPTAPITWGGVGTDAQHAVFQLLHQGTIVAPVEFVASIDPGHALDPAHHRALLVNCFAQGAALMRGKENDADPARAYPGNRPSTTILLEDVTPDALGALIAFYEHRTFANAVLMGINPFDQFGVELGKEIAKSIEAEGTKGFDPSTMALIDLALGGA
ncbi:glucose-6-phosphate isomerase [Sphingomonadales bacterium 56]|uniref:glucose-6-phosphate isomerase n=1 Tax=unclassified Sphingobium TaxID=2611147 RepID=UPI00191A8C9F|nr:MULTISPECIES: glucose-6-phosphate isomerase [unclassified Sphingobium]MBY2927635.1 glucose-6-phosphate isomerase [Sphingomonadales bacterium 56]MBY2957735.1 glucose-6-phosphate isomerase [Sphingomonadales bacterium 58]CAD7335628.1 Glucose-6-phosphate isomerase [Sphingobium sp. S6]CAD7335693.1 Glucose-6-phosphate isomerase [Sphingobium sp. S8]